MRESRMNSEDSESRYHFNTFAAISCFLLLAYALHFGPFISVTSKYPDVIPDAIKPGILAFEWPHLKCAYHSENYFVYMNWWLEFGTGQSSGLTWPDFRRSIEHQH